MTDNSAKILSITAVWISTAAIFIFGIFDFNWRGSEAVILMLIISLSICVTTAYATKKICDSFTKPEETETTDYTGPHK